MPKYGGDGVSGNRLIASLPDDERALLAPVLEHVPLEFEQVLEPPDKPLSHLWFPINGVASMVSHMTDGAVVEVATIGCEGMVGLSEVLGAGRLAQSTFVQVIGEADRISVTAFRELSDRLPALRRKLLRYAAALVTQIAQLGQQRKRSGQGDPRIHPAECRSRRTAGHVKESRHPADHHGPAGVAAARGRAQGSYPRPMERRRKLTMLKLKKLPDRVPVKLGITVPPDLHRALADYAALYAKSYGEEATIADLIPAMLSDFLEADREFARQRRQLQSQSSE